MITQTVTNKETTRKIVNAVPSAASETNNNNYYHIIIIKCIHVARCSH